MCETSENLAVSLVLFENDDEEGGRDHAERILVEHHACIVDLQLGTGAVGAPDLDFHDVAHEDSLGGGDCQVDQNGEQSDRVQLNRSVAEEVAACDRHPEGQEDEAVRL